MNIKKQGQTNFLHRSSHALAFTLAICSPVQARSAEPVEGKAMVMADAAVGPGSQDRMNPYFSAINYNLPKDTLMLMVLPDFQIARTGPNFATGMVMLQYGLTDRLTVGMMAEGQKINGLPATYGGLRFNAYFASFPMTIF